MSGANQAPVLTAIPDKSVTEQTQLSFTATATDPDAGTVLTYSVSGGVDAASFQINPSTGVLSFGQVNRKGDVVAKDPRFLAASPVLMREIHVNGKKLAV